VNKAQKIAAALLLVLLAVTGYGLWVTHPATTPVSGLNAATPTATANGIPVIDEHTLHTALRLARLATTPEEQPFAQSAVQIADHELDLAFAAALHHVETHPPPLKPEAIQIQARLDDAQKRLAADSESVKRLTVELAQAKDADKPQIQDRLDLALAQVDLEQDEVQEAKTDLLQAGGNQHQRIEMMQKEHEAAVHEAPPAPLAKPTALGSLKGMVAQVREWLALHRKRGWLAYAQEKAAESAEELTLQRNQIAAELAENKERLAELSAKGRPATHAGAITPAPPAEPKPTAPLPAGAPGASAAATGAAGTAGAVAAAPTLLSVTRDIANEQRRLTFRDQRISARKRLAAVYGQWDTVVAGQQSTALHACLVSAAIVLVVLLLLLFAGGWLERLLGRARIDRRQLGALRSVVTVSMQVIGVVVILLALIGIPTQFGTMIGLATAGLTVALKDFIVAFVGWFVLMGRNGMRVGDWVEINGVSGEVIELTMFHTVLLETGNWTDTGHPTGRRVTFTNSFAIEGHYFNFSTSGQWLWDELSVMVPYDRDPHAIAAAIQKEVVAATAQSAAQAEQEWRRVARGQPITGFSAQPGIAVRPASGGVEIAVRYVTRASERLAIRARLYQAAVQLLAQHAAA